LTISNGTLNAISSNTLRVRFQRRWSGYSERGRQGLFNPSGTGRGFLTQAGSGIFSWFIATQNAEKLAKKDLAFLARNRIFSKVMPLTSIATAWPWTLHIAAKIFGSRPGANEVQMLIFGKHLERKYPAPVLEGLMAPVSPLNSTIFFFICPYIVYVSA
jgi:hypothetical protein